MADPQSPGRGVSAHRLSTARLYAFLLIFLVAAGYAIWKSDRFQNLFQGISQARLSQALGVPVSFDTVDLRFFPPSVLLANVRIGNDPKRNLPADTPLLEAEEISIGGGVSLVSSTLRLGRIRALRPHVRLIQSADGTLISRPVWPLPLAAVVSDRHRIDSRAAGVLEFRDARPRSRAARRLHGRALEGVPDRYRATLVARRATLQLPAPSRRDEPVRTSAPGPGPAFASKSSTSPERSADPGDRLYRDPRGANALFSGSGRLSIDEVERVFHSALGFRARPRRT